LLEGEVQFGVILPGTASSSEQASGTPTLTLIHPTGLSAFMVERLKGDFEREIRKIFHLPEPRLPIAVELSPVGGSKDGERSFSSDFFPMLILMAMGMVGFLGMPISLVEEKERRTLHALFLTPIRPNELIIGKSLFGLALILFTVVTMVFINNKWLGDQFYFWLIVLMSSLFCLFLGLLISLLASSQASVNALGTSLFMIFQLVPNLSQTSEVLRRFAWLVPSTYVSRALKKALFLDLSKVEIWQDLAVIGGCAMVTYTVVFCMLRWRQYKI
ncbi:MAG TPA: ABC transporter permease, partial [Candidatus Ozemobacteraceae bacterium]|nr:ABC transporter permease [Candidatus Ozemobacteraceae bacterium]